MDYYKHFIGTVKTPSMLQTNEYLKELESNNILRQKKKEEALAFIKNAGINIQGAVKENPLSFTQRICLALGFLGLPKKSIASKLGVNINSISTHYRRIYKKLNVNCLNKAVYVAFSNGYLMLIPNVF